jgi:hypothetical protein
MQKDKRKQLSQILRSQAQPNRQREEVDHLLRIWPEDMGAENAMGLPIDKDFEGCTGLFMTLSPDRLVIVHVASMNFYFETLLVRLRFRQSHHGEWGNCEYDTCKSGVVRFMDAAFQQIFSDAVRVKRGNWRQGRPMCSSIPGSEYERI